MRKEAPALIPNRHKPLEGNVGSLGLVCRILDCGNRGASRIDFLKQTSYALMEYCGCDAVEIWLGDQGLRYRWLCTRRPEETHRFDVVARMDENGECRQFQQYDPQIERLATALRSRDFDASSPCYTQGGSFCTGNAAEPVLISTGDGPRQLLDLSPSIHPYLSLVVTPLVVDDGTIGVLQLKSTRPRFFSDSAVELYEGIARSLGLSIASRRAQARLRERVKEMTCLYGIARITQRQNSSLEHTLSEIVKLLPPAWQFPSIAEARITLDGHSYSTRGFVPGPIIQTADIVVDGVSRGTVQVAYTADREEFVEGYFLGEERSLIDRVAVEVGNIGERAKAREEKSNLQEQLRHADRLATIGQLAAGVAHELNEPLANILGFAQLAQKVPDVPAQAGQDVQKIVAAALHAREVIKKLLLFARQAPAVRSPINLNTVVREGLYFLESRCAKNAIELQTDLDATVPEIDADAAQMQQVLVNLVVNAIHAMPNGGRLTVQTRRQGADVLLLVEDTGLGMSPEVRQQIFIPFFTTKDVNEGTGLGLSVVHGIVTSHGGTICVESNPGRGSLFEVRLPVDHEGWEK